MFILNGIWSIMSSLIRTPLATSTNVILPLIIAFIESEGLRIFKSLLREFPDPAGIIPKGFFNLSSLV